MSSDAAADEGVAAASFFDAVANEEDPDLYEEEEYGGGEARGGEEYGGGKAREGGEEYGDGEYVEEEQKSVTLKKKAWVCRFCDTKTPHDEPACYGCGNPKVIIPRKQL